MLLEIIDKIIDRGVQLTKFRQNSRKQFFESFIHQIYEDFGKVHEQYQKALKKHRRLLFDGDITLEQLINELQEDYLFSEDQRSKLRYIANPAHYIKDNKFFSAIKRDEKDLLTNFLKSIHAYLTSPYTDYRPRMQRFLTGYLEILVELANWRKFRSKTNYKDKRKAIEQWQASRTKELEKASNEINIDPTDPYGKYTRKRYLRHSLGGVYSLKKWYTCCLDENEDTSEEIFALSRLDRLVEEMQHRYGQIGRDYNLLKLKFFDLCD